MLFAIAEKGIKVKMDIKEKLVKLLGKMISPTMTIREQADSLISNEATVVRHGRWIASHDEFCACSIYKYPVYVGWNQTNYCPNCGAKMDGGAD